MEPRLMIGFGLACFAIASWEMSTWNLDVAPWPIVWTGFLQGVAAGILIVPIQSLAFPGLAPKLRTEAAAVFNLVRSFGSSVGVSVTLTLFTRETIANRSRLVEHVTPYNENLRFEAVARGWDLSSTAGLARIEHELGRQAQMLGYSMDFQLLAIGAIVGIMLLVLVRRTKPALS
jgi:DHA2 family multidrug resistance protein